eukprot:3454941-Pyramimonas_sp.AAC.1
MISDGALVGLPEAVWELCWGRAGPLLDRLKPLLRRGGSLGRHGAIWEAFGPVLGLGAKLKKLVSRKRAFPRRNPRRNSTMFASLGSSWGPLGTLCG